MGPMIVFLYFALLAVLTGGIGLGIALIVGIGYLAMREVGASHVLDDDAVTSR